MEKKRQKENKQWKNRPVSKRGKNFLQNWQSDPMNSPKAFSELKIQKDFEATIYYFPCTFFQIWDHSVFFVCCHVGTNNTVVAEIFGNLFQSSATGKVKSESDGWGRLFSHVFDIFHKHNNTNCQFLNHHTSFKIQLLSTTHMRRRALALVLSLEIWFKDR